MGAAGFNRRGGDGRRAMIPYGQMYDDLCRMDAAIERELVAPEQRPPEEEWASTWKRQHGLSPLAFQELLWHSRDARRVEDLMRSAGTVHLGLTLVDLLARHDVARVREDGSLVWRRPLFPETAERHLGLGERVRGWLQEMRPEARFGQLQASVESSARRVDALVRDLPTLGRSVLFLGDDDLTSILLANVLRGRVTVLDVDRRLLDLVRRVAQDFQLDLDAVEHDVRAPLEEVLRRRFDTVHCDPVDDGPWLQLWLRAAVAALIPVAGARLLLSVSPRRLGERYLGLHRFLLGQGFVLEYRVKDLNAYLVSGVGDGFYRTHERRVADRLWFSSVGWAIHTDLLVFRYEGVPQHLWPQEYRERRRGM